MSKNFKYLDDLIHSGVKEIVLDSDIVLDDSEKSYYEEGIRLDVMDLVIDGNGHTIDACGKTRIFYCTHGNVTIKNITLKNGKYGSYHRSRNREIRWGGAIYNFGILTISKSTISHCTSKHGGTIFNEGFLTITDSTLDHNVANGNGGAIFNQGKLKISKSTITHCTSKHGGAIFNDGSQDWGLVTELNIIDSTIDHNVSKGHGGAIYNGGRVKSFITDVYAVFTLQNTSFAKNFANKYGGSIYNNNSDFDIEGCSFSENSAKKGGDVIANIEGNFLISNSCFMESVSKQGGTIYHQLGNFKIFNCEFLNNNSHNLIENNDYLEVLNTKFHYNQTEHAILNKLSKSNLSISNCRFADNKVDGCVIFNDGKYCFVEKSIFENNLSGNASKNIINKTELTLKNCNIKDEGKTILNDNFILIKNLSSDIESKIYGEGICEIGVMSHTKQKFDFGYLDNIIHNSTTKEVILDHDILFENYEIDYYEGGVDLDMDDLIIDGKGHTIDGAGRSRIFLITGDNVTLKNIAFKNGRSFQNYDNFIYSNNGGAIRINNFNKLTIVNCKFINNESENMGGAISNTRGELTIFGSTLNENTSRGGGGIYNGGTLTITDSTLNENTSKVWGGAIYSVGEVTIEDSTFNRNVAKDDGGAIYGHHSLGINESVFNENIAEEKGGAIYAIKGLNVTNSRFKNNVSSYGGTICDLHGIRDDSFTTCIFESSNIDKTKKVFTFSKLNILYSIFFSIKERLLLIYIAFILISLIFFYVMYFC